MICCLIDDGEFLGFLRRSVRAAMGCFFGCFRIKHDHRPQTYFARKPEESRNCLSSLISQERDGSPCKDKEGYALVTTQPHIDDRDLKDEAKFLKACGTILETPTEIRKASKISEDTSSHDGDSEPSKFHSWLPRTSIRKLNLEEHPDQPPTPTQLCEEWVKGCIYNGHGNGGASPSSTVGCGVGSVGMGIEVHANQTHDTGTSSASPKTLAGKVQHKNKSVHFECGSDVNSFPSRSLSSEVASQNSSQSASAGKNSVSKPSPYPTPLKLTDEMQTPGTIFPAYREDMANGKNPRIRSQYVYSVLNPVENFSQWKVMKEEDSDCHQLSGDLGESVEKADNATLQSEVRMRETSAEKEVKVEASLSSWSKLGITKRDGNNAQFGSVSVENTHFRRTPGDRPILGMVAAHWNEDESSRISPKWWDGNGIPNSTNKYKEDQKVSWHATPFEERLEKALSEDSFISQRKHINGTPPIEFDENDEGDTALSKLQSSTQFNSVVTF